MKNLVIYISFLFCFNAIAQHETLKPASLNDYQDSLKMAFKKLYASSTDVEKKQYNKQALSLFEKALNLPNSYSFSFDSLADIARLGASDDAFKLYNWNVPYKDGTQEYFGFIQYKFVQIKKTGLFKKEKTEVIQLYPLIDKSDEIKNPENNISDNKKWFGMLYYKIVEKKTKNKVLYTLLAWDGNDNITKKKIIDILTFDDKGTPHFGADVFDMPKKNPKRIIFEYAAACNMTIKYNTKKEIIVFDHLAPEQPQLEGQYQYYCSDMSYDGFSFKKGKWRYEEDVNVTNEKTTNDKFYNDPRSDKPIKGSDKFVPEKKKKK